MIPKDEISGIDPDSQPPTNQIATEAPTLPAASADAKTTARAAAATVPVGSPRPAAAPVPDLADKIEGYRILRPLASTNRLIGFS